MTDTPGPIHKKDTSSLSFSGGQEKFTPQDGLGALIQRAQKIPSSLQPNEVFRLQRAIGNQAVARYLTAKSASQPAIQATIHPAIQRTLWQANANLEWEVMDEDDEAVAPDKKPTAFGQIYDDETGITYANWEEYEGYDELDMVISEADLPEDEPGDRDFVYKEESGESSGEEDDVAEDDEIANTNAGPEMTQEEYQSILEQSRGAPAQTTNLKDRSGKYPTQTFNSNVKFKRKGATDIEQRSPNSGPVTITLETVQLWVNDKQQDYVRPIAIEGIIEPTTTTGRGGAPDPLSGTQIYMGQEGQRKGSIPVERNMGMPDTERGHIMALELGGPDIPQNIVPQWAKFQGIGEWRQMEVAALATAEAAAKKNQLIRYKVSIYYKETGDVTITINNFGVPTGFRATTQVCDLKGVALGGETEVFNQAQAQDITDTMLGEREMEKIDGPDWDKELNIGKASKKKPRSKKSVPSENGNKKKGGPPKKYKGDD